MKKYPTRQSKDRVSSLSRTEKRSRRLLPASLVMKVGNHNPNVLAVIAFSPGEYFQSKLILKNELKNFDKRIFVASTKNEEPFVQELISGIPKDSVSFYTPSQGSGVHGSKALWSNQPGNEEVWVALLLFFKNIKE